ncbi:MAG TPA: hypothetical protein VGJ23_01325 [Gaiellaceae bacterium]
MARDIQLQNLALWRQAVVAIGERRPADALPLLVEVAQQLIALNFVDYAQPVFADAATAANDLQDSSLALPVAALLDAIPPARRTRPVELGRARESVPTRLRGEKNTTPPPRSTRWRLQQRATSARPLCSDRFWSTTVAGSYRQVARRRRRHCSKRRGRSSSG